MSLTMMTAMVIATNEVICASAGPCSNGKYEGWVTHGPEKHCRPLFNTPPVYDTRQAAEQEMEKAVKDLKDKWEAGTLINGE